MNRTLSCWITNSTEHYGNDIIMVGDWNAAPGAPEWEYLDGLNKAGDIVFNEINKTKEISHMVRLNGSGPAGSRIDLVLESKDALKNAVKNGQGVVIQWSFFEHLNEVTSGDRQKLYKELKKDFSDHLPVLNRYYLKEM